MATPAAILQILVTANTKQAEASLMRLNGELKKTAGAAAMSGGRVSSFAKNTGLALGIAAGVAVKFSNDFSRSMEMIHTQTTATQKEVNHLKGEVLDLAKSMPQGPNDLARALYRLEGAGLRGVKAMRALKASAQLAAVGNADVEDTAKTLAQAWFVNIKGTGKFKDTVAELNATVGAGDLRLQQLVDALGTGILPAAKQVGLSFHDITGALAVFGDETNNVSGFSAQLATALHFITNPTDKATKSLAKLGLGETDLSQDLHKPKGLLVALTDLRDRLEKLPGGLHGVKADQIIGDILPGGRGRILLVLLNQLDRYQQKMEEIRKTHSKFGESVKKTMEEPAVKMQKAWSRVQVLLINIGGTIAPWLADQFEKLTGILTDDKLSGAQKFDKLTQALGKALNDMVRAAAEAAPKVAAAFGRGWFSAPIWAKLIVGGWLIKRMGGFKAFEVIGLGVGRAMGAGITAGAATTVASGGGRGGGAGGGAVAGGLLGSLRGKLLPVAKRVGLIGLGLTLADSVLDEFGRRTAERGPDVFQALKAAGTTKFKVAGVDLPKTLPVPFKVLSDVSGETKHIENAKELSAALEDIAKHARKISPERANELRVALSKLGSLSTPVRHEIASMVDTAEKRFWKFHLAINRVTRSFGDMRAGLVFNVKEMRQSVASNLGVIKDRIGLDTKKGWDLAGKNFQQGVNTIRRFMAEGKLSAKQGMGEINRLMRLYSKMGAEGAGVNFDAFRRDIKRTMTRSGKITAEGLAAVKSLFVTELRMYGLSPKQALAGANVRTGEVAGGRRRQDFQRGGHITGGKAVGDSVHAMLERGEVVVNRRAVQKMGGPHKVNQLNQMYPRFQGGGIAGMSAAANKLEKAHFPYRWGGGHQGSPAPFGPMDCSGAVSFVLQHGGVKIPTMTSGLLASAGQPGPGAATVFANPTHTFMRIGKRFFGTSGSNPGGGAGWFPDPGQAYLSRFAQRHFQAGEGGDMRVPRVKIKGRDSALKGVVQGAVDQTRKGANRKLRKLAAQALGAGDVGDPGPFGGGGDAAANRKLGKKMAARFGWTGAEWKALDSLWRGESGWRNVMNTAGSGATGIPQALPGSKMASEGDDWRTNPATQIRWGLKYIRSVYGDPINAYNQWQARSPHWYQQGGVAGLQKGGVVGDGLKQAKFASGPGQGSFLHRTWGLASPHLGGGGWPYKDTRYGGGIPFVGTAWDPGKQGKQPPELLWPSWLWSGKDALDRQTLTQLAFHEFAHARQKPGLKGWEAEGGAESFARAMMRRTRGTPTLTGGAYGKDVRKVGKRRGRNWVLRDQFGKLPKMAKGGIVGYAGDSLGVGTVGAGGLKGKLGHFGLAANVLKGRNSSSGLAALKGMRKGKTQFVFDLGTNDANAGQTRSSLRSAAKLSYPKPLHYMTVLGPDSANKNRMFRASPGGNEHLIDWAKVAGKYGASDSQVHPTNAGYQKRASMIAASVRKVQPKFEFGAGHPHKLHPKPGQLVAQTPAGGAATAKGLSKTLKVLRSSKSAKARGKALRRFEGRVRGMGLPEGLTQLLATLANDAETWGDRADKAGQLNVDNEDGTTTLGVIQGKTEGQWLNQQLGIMLTWRDKILDAVKIIEHRRKQVAKLMVQARRRLQAVAVDIRQASRRKAAFEKLLKQAKDHPQKVIDGMQKQLAILQLNPKKNKHAIKALQKQIDRAEALPDKKNNERIKLLRGAIHDIDAKQGGRVRERKGLYRILGKDGKSGVLGSKHAALGTSLGNLTGSEGLEFLQGKDGPMKRYREVPPIGTLLGSIFDVQLRLKQLNTPATAKDTSPEESPSVQSALELLRQANLRTAVSEAQFKVLRNFDATSGGGPQFLGSFAKGGVALVGEKGPELAHLPSNTRVHSAEETSKLMRPHVGFIINGDVSNVPRGKDPVEAVINDPRFARRIGSARVGGQRLLPGHGA